MKNGAFHMARRLIGGVGVIWGHEQNDGARREWSCSQAP